MNDSIRHCFVTGTERVAAWADLLDSINVFPIADGDTGRNLKISLSPMRDLGNDRDATIHKLLVNARGNSGNIAARFFSEFLKAESIEEIPDTARRGREQAWNAVHDPKPGTILTVFDALADVLETTAIEATGRCADIVLSSLEQAVRSTPELLPRLKEAGVVDSGALGMYIYFEGFFKSLAGTSDFKPIMSVFGENLRIGSSFSYEAEEGYCVDVTLNAGNRKDEAIRVLSQLGESVVVIPGDDFLKVHLHTSDRSAVKKRMESLGGIIRWSDDDLGEQVRDFSRKEIRQAIHIMTDAAGSVTRDDACRLGITLLDSYITVEDLAAPETSIGPEDLYAMMRRGARITTSQASEFERHELYRSVTDLNHRVLYLCVGSAFTGNYNVALAWKKMHDPDNRLAVIDTGAASGRLGIIALAVSRFSANAATADAVFSFAREAIDASREYLFIDDLHYLAAGGRISKTKAFFGSMMNIKPVVSPTAEGVVKAGTARTLDEQIGFALQRIGECASGSRPFLMVQYTDNRSVMEDVVIPELLRHYPAAEMKLQPLSLTTGVHTGPGTWSLALLPER